MLLILLLKILFSILIISHSIRWVSYHIRNLNKKTRVFHGNTRMPKELEFALMYGLFRKRKKRFKDVSYRKPLNEWMQMLDTIYPPDNLNITCQPNSNLVDGNYKQFPFPKLKTGNNNLSRAGIPLLFFNPLFADSRTQLKNNLLVSNRGQSYAGSRGGQFSIIHKTSNTNTKTIHLNNLKISQNPIPFSKQIFACT